MASTTNDYREIVKGVAGSDQKRPRQTQGIAGSRANGRTFRCIGGTETRRCLTCGGALEWPTNGRPKTTCGARCKFRHRKRLATARRCSRIAAHLIAAGNLQRAELFLSRARRMRLGLAADRG
jgi:hypothetical protein